MIERTECLLGDLCDEGLAELQTGPFGSQLHAYDYVEKGVPVVPTEAIRDRKINHEVLPKITEEKADELARHRLRPGDILFARRGVQATGHIGFVQQEEEGFICGTGAIRLRLTEPATKALPEFLSHVFADPASVTWFKYHAIGATMPNLNEGIIRSFPLTLPDAFVQTQITELLSALDDKIELNRRMNETLEAMARAIFKDWFIDFGPTRAKAEGRAPYLAPEIWDLFPGSLDDEDKPVGWSCLPFGELLDSTIGGDWGKEDNDEKHTEEISVIRGTDIPTIKSGFADNVPSRFVQKTKLERRNLQEGDIVIEVSGGSPTQPTGRSIFLLTPILERFTTPVIPTSFCRLFRPSNERVAPLLACHLDQLYRSGGTWKYQNQSTGIANFQTKYFLESEQVVMANENVLQRFYELSMPLFMRANSNENIALRNVRDFLLPKLMSGEICLREAEKAVEAVA